MATTHPLQSQGSHSTDGSASGDARQNEDSARYRKLFGGSAHGYAVVADGVVAHVTSQLAAILGYTARDMIGRRAEEFVAPQDRERLRRGIERLVGGERDEIGEFIVQRRDGSLVPVEAIGFAAPVKGKPVVFSLVRDITERRRVGDRLRLGEEQLRALFQAIPVPTYAWMRVGDDFTLVDFNDAADAATRGEVSRLVGSMASELYAKDPEIFHDLATCFQSQTTARREMDYMLRSTGEWKRVDVTYAFVPPDCVLVHVEDITERRQAEEAYQQAEERFRLLAEHAQDVIFLFREQEPWRFEVVSPSVFDLVGYGPEHFYADPAFPQTLLHPDDVAVFAEAYANRREGLIELRWIHKDGHIVYTEQQNTYIYGDDGSLLYIEGVIRDVTVRREAEEALRRSEQRFRLLADNAQDMIFRYRVAEPVGFEYVSPAVETIAGYKPEQYYADPDFVFEVVHKDDRESFQQMIADRVVEPVELRWVRPDGSILWTEQRNTYVYDEAGNLAAIEGIVRDITDRKRMERAMQRGRDALEGKVERELQRKNPYGLTFRELTVLHLVAAGQADKEIAAELGISPLTVHKHVANMLAKMEAGSRTEAGTRALREGLID